MLQLPPLPPLWIRTLFQRNRKSEGQDRIEAEDRAWILVILSLNNAWMLRTTHKQYTLLIRGKFSTCQSKLPHTSNRFGTHVVVPPKRSCRCGDYARKSADHEKHRERAKGHTLPRLRITCKYICTTTMTRKYIVACFAKVRISAENLSTLLSR